MVKNYRNQNYSKLRRQAQQEGRLFTDPLFPPTGESLGHSSSQEIVWKRPSEISAGPQLVVEGVSTTDLNQGVLGNCWFVAACSCLASEPKLWEKVIPNWKNQEWDSQHPENYAGIFHFHFWRLGQWVDVVVDDFLPTRNGELVYMKSRSQNEFWSALLEKAYAKLAGSYAALTGGQTGDALVDFTGGVNEAIKMVEGGYREDEEKMVELFERLEKAHKHRSLTCSSIALSEGEEPEKALDCGLIKGHAYAITEVKKLALSSGLMAALGRRNNCVRILKLRNPWGQKEWNGPWSDGSKEWQQVPAKEKEKMSLKVDDDGDFWMELHDWVHWFSHVSICRQVNTKLLSLQTTWHEATFFGEWKGQRAGGCINHSDTFLLNPQYLFKVSHQETDVMLSLMQKDSRVESTLASEGGGNHSIGFHIMKVEENRAYRLHAIQEKAGSITFVNRRSVFGMFTLDQGSYVIVPSTFEPAKEREFLLRLYSERPHHAKELRGDIPRRGVLGYLCCCCWSQPHVLVTVHLEQGHGLKKQDLTGAGADPYCVVKCGRQKAVTPVRKNSLDPNFSCKVHFYLSNPSTSDLTIQVWNHNLVLDSFLGQVQVPVPGDGDSHRHSERLMGRGRHSSQPTQGTLTLRVDCSSNLRAT